MVTVKSFSKGEFGIVMVQDGPMYRIITTNAKHTETGFKTTYSKANEAFDKFVELALAETGVEYAPV